MIKKINLFILLVVFIGSFAACDDVKYDDEEASEEWILFQNKTYTDIRQSGDYQPLTTASNYELYYREADSISKSILVEKPTTRIDREGKPQISDVVEVRYIGWYYNMDNEKVQFDATEFDNHHTTLEILLAEQALIEGWTAMLQEMKEDDEVEVCIPHTAAYGVNKHSNIPGSTTLFFYIKLLRIKPLNQGEWDEWQKE